MRKCSSAGEVGGLKQSTLYGHECICLPAAPCLQLEEQTVIDLTEPVTLTFGLRYLTQFTKATALSPSVVRVVVVGGGGSCCCQCLSLKLLVCMR